MENKELRRLSRTDLLEMLLDLSRENEQLKQEVEELRKQLNDRYIAVEEMGSLAEAALKLNGVFEAAQAACDQYIENIKFRNEIFNKYRYMSKRKTAPVRSEYVMMNDNKRRIQVKDLYTSDEEDESGKGALLRELKDRRREE